MLHNLKVKTRLLMAFAVMFAGLLGFAGYNLVAKWTVRAEMHELERLAAGVSEIGQLVHLLQQERGASSTFIGSKGTLMRDDLAKVRKATDARLAQVSATLRTLAATTAATEFAARINDAETMMAAVADRRADVDGLKMTQPQMFDYYTGMIAKLLDAAAAMSEISSRGDVTTAIATYVTFMHGKEYAGQERATAAAGLAAGRFDVAGYARVTALSAVQDALFGSFLKTAAPPQREAFRRALSGDVSDTVDRMRRLLVQGGLSGDMPGLDAKSWFVAATSRIDTLKGVEDRLGTDLAAMTDAIRAQATEALAIVSAVVLAFFGAGFGLAFVISRSIVEPIRRLSKTMGALGIGEFDVEVPCREHRDEIGDMARSVEILRAHAIERRRLESEQREAELRAVDDKRLAEQQELERRRAAEDKAVGERTTAMHKLADDFERAVGVIVETVSAASTELEATADSLTKTVDATQQLSGSVATTSEHASTNMQSVASATEQMAASVSEISRQVQETARIAGEAVEQAGKTDARILELSESAGRIGDVVKLITAIAEQTNLLALNATIEAARAGEAGRGFAVVAQEVKALAAQTAKATGEIGAQVASMQNATKDSVTSIKDIGATISRISAIAAAVAAAIEEQATTTSEIARNVQEAAQGTIEVASNIVEVNRGACATGEASIQVHASARALSKESNQLRLEVLGFLKMVRTGPADRRVAEDPTFTGPNRRSQNREPRNAVPPNGARGSTMKAATA